MSERIYSLDTMRIIAIWFVVIVHTEPFAGLGTGGNMVNFVLESVARFAVPFFFVTAGYLFALKATNGDPLLYLKRRLTTLSSLYVFGIVLSLPVFLTGTAVGAVNEGQSATQRITQRLIEALSPVEFLYYGTSVSEILWFLPALAVSFLLIYLFIATDNGRYLLPVSLAFHTVGLLGASYTMIVDVPFGVRDGLFFGFFYTSLGYVLYTHAWKPRPERSHLYLGATAVFGGLHITERYVLGYVLGEQTFASGVYSPSYTIATALVTVSLFLFLLSRPKFGAQTPLPGWGTYAVGIYVAHPPVLFVLQELGETVTIFGTAFSSTVLWHLVLTPATFVCTLLVYLGAHRIGMIEIGGSHLPRLGRVRRQSSR